jgi:hypothetical protein
MNLDRHRSESRLHYWLRNAAVSGGALDWLLVFAFGAFLGWTLAGGPL